MTFVQGHCNQCRNTGWVQALSRKDSANYGFRCTLCESAKLRGLSMSIPPWVNDSKKDYELFSNYMARDGWKEEVNEKS